MYITLSLSLSLSLYIYIYIYIYILYICITGPPPRSLAEAVHGAGEARPFGAREAQKGRERLTIHSPGYCIN